MKIYELQDDMGSTLSYHVTITEAREEFKWWADNGTECEIKTWNIAPSKKAIVKFLNAIKAEPG